VINEWRARLNERGAKALMREIQELFAPTAAVSTPERTDAR
jgi:hypothetical protein